MCFPQPIAIPQAQTPPAINSAATSARVAAASPVNRTQMQTVLTSPLGDPNFGKSINRTVLTGVLT